MAHWAELNENNVVIRVTVGDNNDPNGDEGYQWLIDNLGGRWIKTSYNATIRGKFAGIGDIYDEVNDIFYTPVIEGENGEIKTTQTTEDSSLYNSAE